MEKIKVFLDTNVIISSLLSSHGASFEIIQNTTIQKFISRAVKEEAEEVAKRLDIDIRSKDILKELTIISLGLKKDTLSHTYSPYVLDEEDSHVVAGAKIAKAKFLLTHNSKHYQTLKIRNDLGIIVMKPGMFLQHLRNT